MKKKEKKYFVVYAFYKKDGLTPVFGQVELTTNGKIETYEEINEMNKFISKEYCNGETSIVLNYKMIKESKK